MKKNVFIVIAAILAGHLLGSTVASAQPIISSVGATASSSSDDFVIGEPIEVDCDEQSGPNCSGQEFGYGEYEDPVIRPKANVWTTGKRVQKVRVRENNRHSTERVGFETTLVIYLNEDGESDVENLQPLAVVLPKKLTSVKGGHAKKRVVAKIRDKGSYYILRPGKGFGLYSLASGQLEKIKMIDLYGDEILAAYVVAADAPLIWGGTCYSSVSEVSALRCKSPRPWLGLAS